MNQTQNAPLIEAHRGDSESFPENTLAAFQGGVDAGADSIELDVHQTRDGAWIVMHDPTVERTTDGQGAIADMTLAQIRTLDAGSWRGSAGRGQRVPTLDEAARFAAQHAIGLNVEIKTFSDVATGPRSFVDVLRASGIGRDAVVVSSFQMEALLSVRDADEDICLAMLGDAEPALRLALDHRFPWVHANAGTLTEASVAEARAAGVLVMAWTVDDPAHAARLAQWGVHKICTNRPRTMLRTRAALAELPTGSQGQ